MSSDLLAWVNASLDDALRETREDQDFGEQWQSRFGNVLSRNFRHDLKLGLEAPPVRAALTALLSSLQPAIAESLGEDAQLYELAALVSLPGAVRQPVHPDTPHGAGKGTDEGAIILTAFCALQDIDATMGPTLFLPATHTAEAHAAFFTYENFEATFDEHDEDEDVDQDREARVFALLDSWSPWRGELTTGDVTLFDSRALHAGLANTSQRQRVLFYCSFIKAKHAAASKGTLLENLRGQHSLADWPAWVGGVTAGVPASQGAAPP
ncbi:hypothetical protein T484DRAFT_1654906 [Baffinella frigidus]|nr:hypothetical protein T484DRAFT_1654906 [Cryptophyta sp. CCMP2293]